MFTAAVRHCNASTAASLDYLSLLWTLLADALVFHKLPSSLSLCGAAVISAASLGAILWTARAGNPAGGQAAEGEAPKPLQWKRQHYLAGGSSGGGPAAGLGSRTSEAEAVSLIKASRAAEAVAAKEAAAAAVNSRLEGSGTEAARVERHAAKLALLPDELSDSRKSWQLGTEVEMSPIVADAAAVVLPARESGGPRHRTSVHLLAGSTDGALSVELLAVAPAPAGRRTSSEKERALAAAGK